MRNARRLRRAVVALLALLGVVLFIVAANGWRGPVPSAITFAAIFLGPGIGWQNLRGTLRLTPMQLGLAVTTSVGTVIVLGLAMNATSLRLTRTHWAAGMAALLGGLALASIMRPAALVASKPRPRRTAVMRPRLRAALPVVAACAMVATAGALIAWYSQQHWLARQHYTELYATGHGGREVITVHNEEGEAVAYSARIAVAGQPAAIASFSLAAGATWTRTVTIGTKPAPPGQPILDVELSRLGVPGLYRWIRLLHPQPTAQPAS